MKATLLALSAAVLIACAALTESAAQGNTAERVNAIFDRLESQWLERLDVSASLAAGRQDLVTLVRKEPSIAQSWQLEPPLVAEMTDPEIFDFVTRRANEVLACGVVAMSQASLAEPTLARRPGLISQQLWKGAPIEGRFRMSANCTLVLDEDRQPASLTTKDHLGLVNRLMSRFVRPESQQALFQPLGNANVRAAAGARLKANVEYLRSEFGGMPEEEPDLGSILGPPKETQVFSRQVLMFQAFIASSTPQAGRGGQRPADRLVLVVPLSQ